MADLADDEDALFDLPVGEFIAARDDRARRLRDEGRADDAKAVKALRRPTLVAWAINQVVRADGEQYDALVAAGREMQKAQRRALSGVRDTGLRDASAVRRGLVEALTDRAEQALAKAGARPDAHLGDVAATFEAASASPDVAEQVGAGRLSSPVRASAGFSSMTGLLAASLAGAGDDVADDGGDDVDAAAAEQRRAAIRALEAARSRASASATTAREARRTAHTLADEAAAAIRVAEDAERAAVAARSAADELAARAERDEGTAVRAREVADEHARAADAAEHDLDALA